MYVYCIYINIIPNILQTIKTSLKIPLVPTWYNITHYILETIIIL